MREATRLDAEASQVLSGEALRERIAINTRVARLRQLQLPFNVVEADLSDTPTVSSVRQTGKGRSRVFVWHQGQQELSLEDRIEALEEMVAKARSAGVASVPWLGHMLKQVQQLIIEARGTNALCPVAHFGYKPLDMAGCMMKLKHQFEGRTEVSTPTFKFDASDFAPIEVERQPILKHPEMADAVNGPAVIVPKAQPDTRSSGNVSRGAARRLRQEEEQMEQDFELTQLCLVRFPHTLILRQVP